VLPELCRIPLHCPSAWTTQDLHKTTRMIHEHALCSASANPMTKFQHTAELNARKCQPSARSCDERQPTSTMPTRVRVLKSVANRTRIANTSTSEGDCDQLMPDNARVFYTSSLCDNKRLRIFSQSEFHVQQLAVNGTLPSSPLSSCLPFAESVSTTQCLLASIVTPLCMVCRLEQPSKLEPEGSSLTALPSTRQDLV
jgi:hypothetical protein